MRFLIFAALLLAFATACASPVHIVPRGSQESKSISEITIPIVRLAYNSGKSVASGRWGGVVKTTLGGHKCQILRLGNFMGRNLDTELLRLQKFGGLLEVAGDDHMQDGAASSRVEFYFLEKFFFSSSPPPGNKLQEILKEARDESVNSLHSEDPGSFVYRYDRKETRAMAVFIGPPRERDKSTPFKISEKGIDRMLRSGQLVTCGEKGRLVKATFDGQSGQILALQSSLEPKFMALLSHLYEIGGYTGYTRLMDRYYFFFEGSPFNIETPQLKEQKLTEMQKNAMQVYNIEWDQSKGTNAFGFVYDHEMAIYLGVPFSAKVMVDKTGVVRIQRP